MSSRRCLKLACLLTLVLMLSSSCHGFNRKLMETEGYEPGVTSEGSGNDGMDYEYPKPNTNPQAALPVAPAPAP